MYTSSMENYILRQCVSQNSLAIPFIFLFNRTKPNKVHIILFTLESISTC